MIKTFPNSPRFYVKQSSNGLWEIVDSLNGRPEVSSNDESSMRQYCHQFNYPTEAQRISALSARDSFADDCAKYGSD